MNVNGLSNAGFMGGLMQGAQFVEGMQNRTKTNDRADAQATRQQESHEQSTKLNNLKIDEAEQKVLFADLDRDLRAMEETGKTFTAEQWKKYKPVGFDKFNNENWREENKDAGALLHRGMTTGQWDEGALDAFNTTFYDELRNRDKKDGLRRKIIGVKETEDGRNVAILEITGKDGKKYKAPLTKNGTADGEDGLVVFDDDKLEEIYKVQMHRADMAYAIDKAGGDPKKLAQALRRIAFKQGSQEYSAEWIYDENGQYRKARLDKNKNFLNYIGGGKVGGKGKGGGGGGSNGDDSEVIDWKEYRDKRASALKEGDPAMLDQVDSMFESTYGFTVDDFNSFRQQREKHGIYDNPTIGQTRAFLSGSNVASSSRRVENEISQNPQLFGSNQGLADQQQAEINQFAQVSGDDPDGLAAIASQNQQAAQIANAPPKEIAPNPRIAQLESLMIDPSYPDNARAKFEQEYNQLIAEHHGSNKSKPPKKLSRQDEYKQNLELIQSQIANAQSEEERERLSQLLVKTMTEFNKGPGLKDSAHMAAL